MIKAIARIALILPLALLTGCNFAPLAPLTDAFGPTAEVVSQLPQLARQAQAENKSLLVYDLRAAGQGTLGFTPEMTGAISATFISDTGERVTLSGNGSMIQTALATPGEYSFLRGSMNVSSASTSTSGNYRTTTTSTASGNFTSLGMRDSQNRNTSFGFSVGPGQAIILGVANIEPQRNRGTKLSLSEFQGGRGQSAASKLEASGLSVIQSSFKQLERESGSALIQALTEQIRAARAE